jgi:hypothetical protein
MSQVFISYNHEDGDFTEILRGKLEQAGFTVWADTALRGGDDWRRGIDQAIREAFALIAVMTPEAKASEYVTYEWAFAVGAEVKVIPILLKRTGLHPRLESLQYLDFTSRQARPWEKLISVLREAEASKPEVKPRIAAKKIEIEDRGKRNAYERMMKGLKDEAWTWRSIERLATMAGIAEEEATEILRYDPNVIFSVGKSKRKIAKLRIR